MEKKPCAWRWLDKGAVPCPTLGGHAGARWGRSLGNAHATALLPPGGGDLPGPRFQFSGGYLVPACRLAPWKCCHCGGLALAVPWLSCARHPPLPPTVTPVGVLVEVHSLQRCFVLVLELGKCPGAGSRCVGRGLWAQHCVFIFPCWSRAALAPWAVSLCSLHRCGCADVLMFCAGVCVPRAKCQGQSRRAAFLEQTSLLPLPQHPSFCLSSPSGSIPLPLRVRAKCPRCHHAHVLDCGCRTPSRSPTKLLLLGTEQGWGGRPGMCPPEYQ